ncbi:MAG TPA: MerR family transcriptional regulator [Rhodospirillaceae bacterium]|nr:MerR family transcriptional regulator [Rhodospirillaceae bacterium]HAA91300.1 MerR family transcriptional regulator [Rhodospirillaceae bacterium]HAT35763.1 MerR family transcriptional regulator [Rhodospirillaceae bacterium]|tara:strand:- start:10 stop:480 length:471 start_codon:yes stop_codon:yes gene_type:complete
MADNSADAKSADAFRTISEVSGELDVPQHVLRFWETKFTQVKPMKRGGGRRYYRPDDVALLMAIRALLYDDGYTIRGVQRLLREKGVRSLLQGEPKKVSSPEPVAAPATPAPATTETTIAPVIKTVVDPSGIGEDKRSELEAVLKELHVLQTELRR